MEWIERPLSWLLANRKGHDAGLIQHTPPFTEHPEPLVTVECPDIGPSGSQIPVKYSFFGENLFPTLKWSAPPAIASNIQEWLLVVEDPDAPLAEPVVHGLYYGIPASKRSVSNEDFKPTAAGSHVLQGGFRYGANRRGTIYIPPRGMLGHGPHRYFFQVIGLLEPLVVTPVCHRNCVSMSDEKQQQQQDAQEAIAKETQSSQNASLEDFSVFTTNEKRAIVLMGSLAGFFSPLSSSIYFPALDTIASSLKVSITKINLTVTTYLLLQGASPMLIAGFSDKVGRRPAYIICFTIYIAANIGLSLQNSYAALMVLRCIQSAGSSGTVALSNGLVGDMITSAERGSYIAFASIGLMLGPSLSPIIGGLISQYLDWHWIFWFLLILSSVFFAILLLFLPETCRKVVGDGSVPPPPLNNNVTDIIRHRRRKRAGLAADQATIAEYRKNYRFQLPNPLPTLLIAFELETGLILLAAGLVFAGFYAVMTGASTSFHELYGFNDIQSALMYIPIGAGGIVASFVTGPLVDWNYRRHALRAGLPVEKRKQSDLSNFNVERARLEIALPAFYICCAMMIAYGWVMNHKVNLAGPVILLFLFSLGLSCASQVLNALLVDLWPKRSAAATAANNLFRCELGAGASAAIAPMTKAMGHGWAYTTLALICVFSTGCLWWTMFFGIRCRQKRAQKEQARRRN
ncbi:hypothetical protein CNMCM6805_010337 [Aspergillus fumigatiaffinis]|uniref:Major facilitator superfamily (MFS) profile domain-containing protein n=1 Tax=Aspergillus fumigatiaffinis TaxID=340414 RepID=A0A8H4M7I1_9EURO|nr:hypothetical protein CNMCM6805_010337 [Aspergillus fumigatiaffinis]